MKNFQKSISRKLAIEKFFKEQLWQFLIVTAFILIYAWIFDKWLVSAMFCVSHCIIRMFFEKQYHCGKTFMCLFTTLTIAFFGIMFCLPLNVSLLSVIPVCFFICWIGYITQDRIDCLAIIKKLQNKTIWQMDENELADYCYAKGVRGDKLEFVIMIIIYNLTFAEISKRLYVSIDTLKHIWSPQCKQKLGIENWKQDIH